MDRKTLARWCDAGFPHIRTPRGQYRFSLADVEAWERAGGGKLIAEASK